MRKTIAGIVVLILISLSACVQIDIRTAMPSPIQEPSNPSTAAPIKTGENKGITPGLVQGQAALKLPEDPPLVVEGQHPIDTFQCNPAGNKSVDAKFTIEGQKTDSWCWAATAQMVMGFHGVTQRQCEMVTNYYKDKPELANQSPPILDCCPDTTTDGTTKGECYLTGWPQFVFDKTEAPHFTYSPQQRIPPTIPWSVPPDEPFQDNLVNEICQNRPFIFSGQALDGNGIPEDAYHVGVVIRYQNKQSETDPAKKEKWVGLVDPYDGYKDKSYKDFAGDNFFVYYSDWTHILPTSGGN